MMSYFNNLTTIQKSLVVSILSIILFVASAAISYPLFSKTMSGGNISQPLITALPGPGGTIEEDANDPKTEICPLNGAMKSKKAKNAWEKRLPLAVMIENHTEARPQSGLSYADVVYEAVAEGGITRFMAVFLCVLPDVQVGPVRSARTYYIDWLSEYNDPLYAHVGGANTPGPADALGQIIKYGINDLNQFSIGFPTYWRDYQRLGRSVATEHTMYSTTQKLWDVATKRGWVNDDKTNWESGFIPWKFKDDLKNVNAALPPATAINVDFWQGYNDYSVAWDYDATCNCYKRKNGGMAQTDMDNKQQLLAKNIVVQLEKESHANDGYENNVHLLYGTTGTGKALIFQDSKVIEGKWSKPTRLSRTKYTDNKGSEISFNRGVVWIQTVPEGAKVTY